MNSDIAIEMLADFNEVTLRRIAENARHRANLLRGYTDLPFNLDDARRFDALADAIGALWPRKD